ncbi:MAG: acyltransferase [Flavobacteriales bacterium]|nr:acyltransferase [Flavobacteriales bacterium]
MRSIAFLAIFMHHGFFTTEPSVVASFAFKAVDVVTKPAWLGVPFFFSLSGFLITYLLLTEQQHLGRISVGKFYARRILRIWPLYYAVVCFGFFIFPLLRGLILHDPYVENATLWKYLVFLGNFDMIEKGLPYGAGLGVTWSLSVEEQFYLVWPILFILVPVILRVAFVVLLFALSQILMQVWDLPYTHTLGSMSDLAMGALLAILSFGEKPLFKKFTELPGSVIAGVYVLGIAHLYSWTLYDIGNRVFVSFFMAFVLFDQCFCRNSPLKLRRFKLLGYWGRLTYGLYLLHTIGNFIVSNAIKPFRAQIDHPLLIDMGIQPVASLLLTMGMAYVSYSYYEKPFLKLKSRFATTGIARSGNATTSAGRPPIYP